MTDKQDIIVHGATMADLSELMRLLRLMHSEGGLFPLDEDLAKEMFVRALKDVNKEGIIGVIRGDKHEVRGAIFLLLTRMWYTQDFHIEELFNFIDPEHRKSNYADALIRYAQHARQKLGIPLVLGVLTNVRMEEKVRLYRRRLGMPAGAFFVDGAEWVSDRAPDDSLWKTHYRRKRRHGLSNTNGTATISLSGGT